MLKRFIFNLHLIDDTETAVWIHFTKLKHQMQTWGKVPFFYLSTEDMNNGTFM